MVFIVFIIAWLILLVIFQTSHGKLEDNPLAWLLLVVIVVCALYTMFTVNILAGLAMFGSLSAFEVVRKNKGEKEAIQPSSEDSPVIDASVEQINTPGTNPTIAPYSSPTLELKAIKRFTSGENAEVADNQALDQDTVPLTVVRLDGEGADSAEFLYFYCPWCDKAYQVGQSHLNLIKANGEAIIRSSLGLEVNDDRTTKNQSN